MAPKKEAKKKLPPCPAGITPGVWEIANTLARLIPFFSGEQNEYVPCLEMHATAFPKVLRSIMGHIAQLIAGCMVAARSVSV